MPTSKKRKIRDKSKPIFKKREEPYSYPVGEWLMNEKGLTAADSEIVRAHESEAEEWMREHDQKVLREVEEALADPDLDPDERAGLLEYREILLERQAHAEA